MNEDRAPRKHHNPPVRPSRGLIMVFTGDGKGKTTAAMGTALRAAGHDQRVVVVQFIKGSWPSGEQKAAATLGERFKIYPMGEGFTWDTKDFEKDKACAERAWQKCCELIHDSSVDLVIMDEIHCCLTYGFLDESEVARALRHKPSEKHLILTGRGAPAEIRRLADLVTEMKCLKHPYEQGILAQKGIDY